MTPKQNFCILFFLVFATSFSQTPKKMLHTKFTSERITIDGEFNEEAWKSAEIATNFVMEEPDNGKEETHEKRSEVKVVYNNDAIYIAATLYDDNPDNIKRELTTRDDFATADHFGVLLNGYNDGQQEFRFFVSSMGVQQDCIYTEAKGEDFSWNAIWDSKVKITSIGWVVEMKIPYAALRFSSEKKQTWGINFFRDVRNMRQKYTWNLFSNTITNKATQSGILEGIENIQPPTRLFLIPYSSFYLSSDKETTQGELKGGLDIKYGINDAFTLDAILVPDFGQTAFDRVQLNLGPFEQQFNENRPFFTEGTELFSKGNLVYTRRIGGSPSTEPTLGANEVITKYPETINLLNALKLSGRTKGGLGIGVLNAITKKTYADIRDTITGRESQQIIEPLANYNILVLDQRFRKNSSVSFVNTNVLRNGHYRDANVSALVYDLNTKKNTYNLSGDYKYSFINEIGTEDKTGYNATINFRETSGNYRFSTGAAYVSRGYDNNDLGINFLTHYHSFYLNSSYRILNPNKTFNTFRVNVNSYAEFDNRTNRIQSSNLNINANCLDKRNDYFSFGISGRPLNVYDFYEPRTANEEKFFMRPKNISFSSSFSSNYNRKFAIDLSAYYYFINVKDRNLYSFFIGPRYRFSDRFALIYGFEFYRENNDRGYIDEDATNIYFTRRNVITYTNTLTGKYTVNNTMNFNLAVRHYWSHTMNHEYFTLMDDGDLMTTTSYTANKDRNFSNWNLDLSYSWWFAPGSQISVLYRNNASLFETGANFDRNFDSNIKKLVNNDNLTHIFSISIRYFIDYNSLKR